MAEGESRFRNAGRPYDEDRVRLCGSDRLLADEMIRCAIGGDAWLLRVGLAPELVVPVDEIGLDLEDHLATLQRALTGNRSCSSVAPKQCGSRVSTSSRSTRQRCKR